MGSFMDLTSICTVDSEPMSLYPWHCWVAVQAQRANFPCVFPFQTFIDTANRDARPTPLQCAIQEVNLFFAGSSRHTNAGWNE